MVKKNDEKCCGNCCWFYGEDTYGYGICPYRFAELQRCSDKCPIPEKYVSKKEMRHHMAVLLQDRRCMHDCNVRALRKPVDSIERGKAIEFAYKYMKVFSEL